MDKGTSFAPGTVMPKRRRRRLRASLFPYLLIAPAVLLVLAVVVYPALYAMRVSTMSQNLLRMALAEYIGPGNYLHAIEDSIFLTSLGNTARWVVVVAGAQLALALPIALLLNTDYRGRGVVRTSILIPWVAPPAVVAILWIYMFDANFGIVNDILVRLGAIESYVAWRSLPVPSFSMLVAAMAWTGFPFFAIVLLAALQAIPDDLYEAARVDGAGVWQRFRFITLPLLIPTILLVLLLRTIWLSQSVDRKKQN